MKKDARGNLIEKRLAFFLARWYNKTTMKFDFLNDLDDYFCETYANYDRLCVLPGYRMPKMQDTRVDDYGRKIAYTLPANTMRLALQENKAELLKRVKDGYLDKSFSFTFRPISLWRRFTNLFSKVTFLKVFKEIAAKHGLSAGQVFAPLNVPEEAQKGILKGKFYPSKNLLISMALTAHFNEKETKVLLDICGYEFDFEEVKDVVVTYLLLKGIYNPAMVQAALDEYGVKNLFIKQE